MAASLAGDVVKIPPDWLRVPNYETRSDLYDARRGEMKQLALQKTRISPYFERKFGCTESIFRDSYRKSGVAEVLNKAAQLDPSQFHPRAVSSGLPTRTMVLNQRLERKRLESLKFEPPEIIRLMDIPKPGAPELEKWWTKADGYVEDTALMRRSSLRLQLSPKRRELGPMDPAKERSPASVDERRRVRDTKAMLAEKVTKISHVVPTDYNGQDRVEAGVIIRATDLYAQERRQLGGGTGERSRSESSLALPISPIKPNHFRSPKRAHRYSENLFLESTNQRVLLDQIKSCAVPSPLGSPITTSPNPYDLPRVGTRSPSSAALPEVSVERIHSVKDYRTTIRCGGFA